MASPKKDDKPVVKHEFGYPRPAPKPSSTKKKKGTPATKSDE
jgi:hypothetical protein